MKFFSDLACATEVQDFYLGVCEAEKSHMFEFFVQNDKKCYIRELKFFTENPEVKVVFAPESLNAGEVGKCSFGGQHLGKPNL